MKNGKKIETFEENATLVAFIVLEAFILFSFFLIFSLNISAVVGEGNVTVESNLSVGNSYPEIINITINGGAGIDLTPNASTTVIIEAIILDYNGDVDINSVTSEFFDNAASAYGNSDDNNEHYTNNTCVIDTGYGDAFEVNATCTFQVEYYANNATWNATLFVNDSLGSSAIDSELETINTLLALALPNQINYGETNATAVSTEQLANVTNMGNVIFNLSTSGYAKYVGDGNAMNCTLGILENISIDYEKYNLTTSNFGTINLAEFESNYTNLTSSPYVNLMNLPQRQNDTNQYVDDTNSTYWRIYVPVGVAGSCSGNIIFGAVQSPVV